MFYGHESNPVRPVEPPQATNPVNAHSNPDIALPSRGQQLGDVNQLRQVGSAATTEVAVRNRTARPVYFCNVPGCTSRGFTQRHNFEYHNRSHTNSRPFVCNDCKRGFNSRSDLNRHNRRVHQA
ncbi:hypothetical protein PM082_011364 [Marasmius tenuissimus]|nr:hypothetical protein PM082_011364 [Marasmius tenuissimus]